MAALGWLLNLGFAGSGVSVAASTKDVISLVGRYAPTYTGDGRYAPTASLVGRNAGTINLEA